MLKVECYRVEGTTFNMLIDCDINHVTSHTFTQQSFGCSFGVQLWYSLFYIWLIHSELLFFSILASTECSMIQPVTFQSVHACMNDCVLYWVSFMSRLIK